MSKKTQLKRSDLTDQEWQAVCALFEFLREIEQAS
jgi:hypothetical protein